MPGDLATDQAVIDSIKSELMRRFIKFQTQETYQQQTKASIEEAIHMLNYPVAIPDGLIIPTCIGNNERYKGAIPAFYKQLLQNLDHQVCIINQKTKPPAREIVINKKEDEFFVSIGKSGIHNFVMLGVIKNGKPILLARVGKTNQIGKYSDKNLKNDCILGFQSIFSHSKSELRHESLHPFGDIHYSAYSINYDQYAQFLRIAQLAQGTDPISCYQPVWVDKKEEYVVMEFNKLKKVLNPASEAENKIIYNTRAISGGNTCRHTAIELIEYTQGTQGSHAGNISRNFFDKLSLTTEFSKGKPTNSHFYVFPLPPKAYSPNKDKAFILTKIYKKMEDLLQKDPNGTLTIQKFDALKKLYKQQAGVPNNDLGSALLSLRQWKEENDAVIIPIRMQGFLGKLFGSSSTTKILVDDLELSLKARVSGKTMWF